MFCNGNICMMLMVIRVTFIHASMYFVHAKVPPDHFMFYAFVP